MLGHLISYVSCCIEQEVPAKRGRKAAAKPAAEKKRGRAAAAKPAAKKGSKKETKGKRAKKVTLHLFVFIAIRKFQMRHVLCTIRVLCSAEQPLGSRCS